MNGITAAILSNSIKDLKIKKKTIKKKFNFSLLDKNNQNVLKFFIF